MARKAEKYTLEDSSREKKKSKKAFVDRVEAIRCFEKELNELREDREAYSVIYYWGVGGIGKTHLMEHLLREAAADADNTALVDIMPTLLSEDQLRAKYTLDVSTNEVEILYRIRTRLKEEHVKRCGKDFDFLLFDLAVASYEEKINEEHRTGDNTSSKSSIFNDLRSIGEVTGLELPFSDVYQLAKGGYSVARNLFSRYADGKLVEQYTEYITSINSGNSEQILKKLHRGFSYDLVRMVEGLQKSSPESLPIIIAIDTMERLDYKTAENINNLEYDDSWLFGQPGVTGQCTGGLIESVPGVLWLLCGRDRIDEAKLPLEYQIRIDKIEEADIRELLRIRDVSVSDEIASLICEVTEGVPAYLDICIDLCIEKEDTVTKADFEGGITQIVNRYLQLMSDQDKLNLYLMSSLGQWTDDDFINISNRLSDFRNLEISYNKLIRKSFIYSEEDCRRIFHNIVREAIYADRDYSDKSKKDNFKTIVRYYKEQMEEPGISNEKVLYLADRIIFLCQEIISDPEEYELIVAPINKCDELLRSIDMNKVLELRTVVCSNQEKYGVDIGESAWMEVILGITLAECGRYQEGIKVLHEVSGRLTAIAGENHPATLMALHNLATVLYNTGQYKEALALRKKVCEKRKEVLGEDHPETLISLNNLAISYASLGQFEEAMNLRKEVYIRNKTSMGDNHPMTITALSNLSFSYINLGRYEEALKLQKEVFERSKEVYGENHLDTVTALSDLSNTYSDLGLNEEALKLQKEVYEKRKKILGEDHPDTITVLANLAITYHYLGNNEEALKLQKEIYEKRKVLLGEDHPYTINTQNNMAVSYASLGQHDEALKIRKVVYEKSRRILGEDHPKTITALSNLAGSLSSLNQNQEALNIRIDIYEKRRKKLGDNHPDTLSALNSIAVSFSKLGQYRKAFEAFRAAYEKRGKILGEYHPDTLTSLSGVGDSYYDLGDYDNSLRINEVVYERRKKVLGEGHPDTVQARKNIYWILSKQKKT